MDDDFKIKCALRGKRQGGTIEQWRLYTYGTDKVTGKDIVCVLGYIYNDTRYRQGADFRTSLVEIIDLENNVVETLNTFYTLGEPAKEQPGN